MSRLSAVLELMDRDGIDALILGREANVRTVSDAARLWLTGARPFSPGCVVLLDGGAVHLLANTDAVVPAGFPTERLYGITWNREHLLGSLQEIAGLDTALRIAVDGITVGTNELLSRAAPKAEFLDAGGLFTDLWRTPDPAAKAGVAAARAIAESGLQAIARELKPGAHPRELRGLCAEVFARHGVTTPAFEAVVADPLGSTWLPLDRPLEAGEAVVVRVGALAAGWDASLARTHAVGEGELPAPAVDCEAGMTVGEVRRRAAVIGLGRGVELWPDDLLLKPGHQVSLEISADERIWQDVVSV